MAFYYDEPSHTFSEYLLIPGYTGVDCIPSNVSLKTPVVKYKRGEKPALTMKIPLVSAIMQAVSGERMAVALAREGGITFIYGNQTINSEANMVRAVKNYKAGFVTSDSNLTPNNTLQDILDLKAKSKHSTVAVTDDGTAHGKLLGMVTSRDYTLERIPLDAKVSSFMTPIDKLVCAQEGITLQTAYDMIWEHKLNTLPVITKDGDFVAFVFRKDYDQHKENPLEMLDGQHRYIVGAGVNTKDYEQRIPALVEAGADILCIDSSEGYTEWQKRTLQFVRKKYGDTVKIGAGNVVDRDGFRFLADAGADFVKVGIGGGSICITRETKGIGRGQATAVIEVAKARDEYY
ncbi:MAG: IMP dehydrogenase, partial [Victivallales bacterium]|nr:IMP dehydrogenase [Victivallales bacterium]